MPDEGSEDTGNKANPNKEYKGSGGKKRKNNHKQKKPAENTESASKIREVYRIY